MFHCRRKLDDQMNERASKRGRRRKIAFRIVILTFHCIVLAPTEMVVVVARSVRESMNRAKAIVETIFKSRVSTDKRMCVILYVVCRLYVYYIFQNIFSEHRRIRVAFSLTFCLFAALRLRIVLHHRPKYK